MTQKLKPNHTLTPLRIAVIYAIIGGLWILLSDRLVASFFDDTRLITRIQTYKGWFYIIVTAGLLHWLIRLYAVESGKTTKALRKSEQYNRALFESSPIGLALCRMDGKLIDINPAYAGIIGRTVEETLKLPYWDITPEKYAEQETLQLESLKNTGRYGPDEKEYIHKDGRLVPVSLSGLIIEKGGENFIWSSVEDITERKQSEKALRESEARFKSLFENNPLMLFDLDTEGTVLSVNAEGIKRLGYSAQELVGQNVLTVFHEEDKPLVLQQVKSLLTDQTKVGAWQVRKVRKDGAVIWVNEVARLMDWPSGQRTILVSCEDITRRKKAEESLWESERKYRELVENANSITLRWSRDGKVTFINEFGQKFFGYTEAEILGRHVVGTIVPETESTGRGLSPLMDQITSDPKSFEQNINENMRKNGERVWISWTNKVVLDEQGQIKEILSIGSDITGRKQIEQELEKHREHLEELVKERTAELHDSQRALMNIMEDVNEAKEQLARANERLREVDLLKSMFIASMSHELRTPLNSVIGFSSILLNEWSGPLNAEQKENLATVLRSGKHLLALINDVIDVSKIEAGIIDLHIEEFDLYDVIAEVVGMLKKEVAEKDLVLNVETIHILVTSNRRRLLQCVLNLMSNAIKFTLTGSIEINVKKGLYEKAGMDGVIISVKDTGIGMKEEDIPRLFHSFVRLDSPLRSTVLGTGLGLYLTKKLVTDVLRGKISVQSAPGAGSVFTLKIPVNVGSI